MDFIKLGVPTDEGARVLAHLREQCAIADANRSENQLAGHVGFYYINVYKTRFLSENDWLKSYPNAATAAYSDLMHIEEAQAAQAQDAAEKTRISESLDEVKAALAIAMQRIDELEKAQKPADEPAAEPTPEPEVAAEPVESKPSKKAQKAEVVVEAEAETEA
jgi:hypothetical protein